MNRIGMFSVEGGDRETIKRLFKLHTSITDSLGRISSGKIKIMVVIWKSVSTMTQGFRILVLSILHPGLFWNNLRVVCRKNVDNL